MKILEDVFKGIKNREWDLARISGGGSILVFNLDVIWSAVKQHWPDWTQLGLGYAALLGGAAAFVGIKDIAKAKAEATTATSDREDANAGV